MHGKGPPSIASTGNSRSPIAPRSPRVARSAACRPPALPSRDGRAALLPLRSRALPPSPGSVPAAVFSSVSALVVQCMASQIGCRLVPVTETRADRLRRELAELESEAA